MILNKKIAFLGRTPWSCGLIPHELDWKVEGSNFAAAKDFSIQINKNLFTEVRAKKREHSHSLVKAVAVGEEEETRRERERSGGII